MTRAFSFLLLSPSTRSDVISDGSLVLKVGASCIQLAAKRTHREVTTALLEGRAAGATLGALADTLERFLVATDVSLLRADHPELAGGTPSRVRLRRHENGSVRWNVVEPR